MTSELDRWGDAKILIPLQQAIEHGDYPNAANLKDCRSRSCRAAWTPEMGVPMAVLGPNGDVQSSWTPPQCFPRRGWVRWERAIFLKTNFPAKEAVGNTMRMHRQQRELAPRGPANTGTYRFAESAHGLRRKSARRIASADEVRPHSRRGIASGDVRTGEAVRIDRSRKDRSRRAGGWVAGEGRSGLGHT